MLIFCVFLRFLSLGGAKFQPGDLDEGSTRGLHNRPNFQVSKLDPWVKAPDRKCKDAAFMAATWWSTRWHMQGCID